MRTASFAPFAVLLAPVVVFTAVFAHRPAAPADAEVERLRRHFATVEQELLARDVSQLSPAQRHARAQHIERLRVYARAGVFPKNTDFPGRRVPYFVDRFGTRCAMAYLIEQSGHGDYVTRVAATRNNAFIADLASDPELAPPLAAWLEENGLTVEEAARIQPMYCDPSLWGGPGPPPGCPVDGVIVERSARSYLPHTIVALGVGGGTLISNARGTPAPWVGGLGVASGIFGIVAGSTMLGDESVAEPLALTNLGVGLLSAYFGLQTLLRSAPDSEPLASTRLSPWVPPEGGAGVAVNVSF